MAVPNVKLNNGNTIPMLGFGTWNVSFSPVLVLFFNYFQSVLHNFIIIMQKMLLNKSLFSSVRF